MNPEYAMARDRLGLYVIAQSKFDYAPFQQEGICLVLEQIMQGRFAADGNKVAIHAPPRMGKSEIGTIHFPAWYLGHFPNRMAMVVSGSADLAIGFGRKTRNLIESDLHREVFPKCQIEWDSRAKDDFSLTAGGHYWAMGFDGQITGKGAHLLVIDDPIKSTKDAESDAAEKSRRDIFDSAIFPRLEPGGLLVLNMTKWPGDTFSGWLMEKFGAVDITRQELVDWRVAA